MGRQNWTLEVEQKFTGIHRERAEQAEGTMCERIQDRRLRVQVQGDARARLGPSALLGPLLWVTEIPRCFALFQGCGKLCWLSPTL